MMSDKLEDFDVVINKNFDGWVGIKMPKGYIGSHIHSTAMTYYPGGTDLNDSDAPKIKVCNLKDILDLIAKKVKEKDA